MDKRKGGCLQYTQKTCMWRTGAPHAKVGRTVQNGGGHIKFCDRGNTQSKRHHRKMASHHLLFHHLNRGRKKLWHLWQRTSGHCKVPTTLVNIPHRSTTPHSHPHQPLQPPILERTTKDQLMNMLTRTTLLVQCVIRWLSHLWFPDTVSACLGLVTYMDLFRTLTDRLLFIFIRILY